MYLSCDLTQCSLLSVLISILLNLLSAESRIDSNLLQAKQESIGARKNIYVKKTDVSTTILYCSLHQRIHNSENDITLNTRTLPQPLWGSVTSDIRNCWVYCSQLCSVDRDWGTAISNCWKSLLRQGKQYMLFPLS